MRNNKSECSHWIIDLKPIDLIIINKPAKELRCVKCDTLVGWWDITTNKIKPIRRAWSKVEKLAMRQKPPM